MDPLLVPEIFTEIVSTLDTATLTAMRLVCEEWRAFLSDAWFWRQRWRQQPYGVFKMSTAFFTRNQTTEDRVNTDFLDLHRRFKLSVRELQYIRSTILTPRRPIRGPCSIINPKERSKWYKIAHFLGLACCTVSLNSTGMDNGLYGIVLAHCEKQLPPLERRAPPRDERPVFVHSKKRRDKQVWYRYYCGRR